MMASLGNFETLGRIGEIGEIGGVRFWGRLNLGRRQNRRFYSTSTVSALPVVMVPNEKVCC